MTIIWIVCIYINHVFSLGNDSSFSVFIHQGGNNFFWMTSECVQQGRMNESRDKNKRTRCRWFPSYQDFWRIELYLLVVCVIQKFDSHFNLLKYDDTKLLPSYEHYVFSLKNIGDKKTSIGTGDQKIFHLYDDCLFPHIEKKVFFFLLFKGG